MTENQKSYLIKGKLLDRIMRTVEEWENLVVRDTKAATSKLTKGRAQSILEITTNADAAAGGASAHPFKIVRAASNKVSIIYGSVNGVGATVNGSLNDGSLSTKPTLTLSDGANNIFVQATWTSGTEPLDFSSCDVRVGATPQSTDTTESFGIGSVLINGSQFTINQGVTSSLACARYKCANGVAAVYYWEGV